MGFRPRQEKGVIYESAYTSGIDDYLTLTYDGFGSGKESTHNMIVKWNADTSENKNQTKDMWGVIQEKVYGANYGKSEKTVEDVEWFIPSRGEWSIFAKSLGSGLTSSNYFTAFDLKGYYWSSSLRSTDGAWYSSFFLNIMFINRITSSFYLRFATTF